MYLFFTNEEKKSFLEKKGYKVEDVESFSISAREARFLDNPKRFPTKVTCAYNQESKREFEEEKDVLESVDLEMRYGLSEMFKKEIKQVLLNL